jgi:hypothetical protein
MQARGFLPQKTYRWEQIEFAAQALLISNPVAGGDTDSSRGELPDAALIEKWFGCFPTARMSLTQSWSRSGFQLHTPYT